MSEADQKRMRETLAGKAEETNQHKARVRALLAKHDPATLAFCDAAKSRFDAKLTGLRIQTELGWQHAGELAPLKPPADMTEDEYPF